MKPTTVLFKLNQTILSMVTNPFLVISLLYIFFMRRTVECYDPKKDKWRFVAPMNNQRDGACVVTEGHYIYVISGYDGNNYLSSVEMYNPGTDVWSLGGKKLLGLTMK